MITDASVKPKMPHTSKMIAVKVSDGEGGHRLVLRPAPPPKAKGKTAALKADPVLQNPELHAERLKQFIARIEAIEEERFEVSEQIREVKADAKALGYDRKTISQIVRLRRIHPDDLANQEILLDAYLATIGEI
jgi:uncharacterized protein (UPF0335 family)